MWLQEQKVPFVYHTNKEVAFKNTDFSQSDHFSGFFVLLLQHRCCQSSCNETVASSFVTVITRLHLLHLTVTVADMHGVTTVTTVS